MQHTEYCNGVIQIPATSALVVPLNMTWKSRGTVGTDRKSVLITLAHEIALGKTLVFAISVQPLQPNARRIQSEPFKLTELSCDSFVHLEK